jgi:hypothetical protein
MLELTIDFSIARILFDAGKVPALPDRLLDANKGMHKGVRRTPLQNVGKFVE